MNRLVYTIMGPRANKYLINPWSRAVTQCVISCFDVFLEYQVQVEGYGKVPCTSFTANTKSGGQHRYIDAVNMSLEVGPGMVCQCQLFIIMPGLRIIGHKYLASYSL